MSNPENLVLTNQAELESVKAAYNQLINHLVYLNHFSPVADALSGNEGLDNLIELINTDKVESQTDISQIKDKLTKINPRSLQAWFEKIAQDTTSLQEQADLIGNKASKYDKRAYIALAFAVISVPLIIISIVCPAVPIAAFFIALALYTVSTLSGYRFEFLRNKNLRRERELTQTVSETKEKVTFTNNFFYPVKISQEQARPLQEREEKQEAAVSNALL